MFKKIFKNKTDLNQHSFLTNYANRDKYFVRIKPWDWLNEKEIYVTDKVDGKPKMITFGFWSQEIYLDSNGQITVSELIDLTCKQYADSNLKVPVNIDKDIIEALESLVNNLKIVEFKNNKTPLPKEVDLPISKQ